MIWAYNSCSKLMFLEVSPRLRKHIKKHWFAQGFVHAKSAITVFRSPYKTCRLWSLLEVRVRGAQDLCENVTFFALKQCSERENGKSDGTCIGFLLKKHWLNILSEGDRMYGRDPMLHPRHERYKKQLVCARVRDRDELCRPCLDPL